MEIGASVNLGEFGTFRPSFGCKSQENAEEVTTETLKNRKIIFTPGDLLKNMIKTVSIQKLDVTRTAVLLLQVVEKKAEETKEVMTAVMKHRTRQYKESFYIVIFREEEDVSNRWGHPLLLYNRIYLSFTYCSAKHKHTTK